MQNTDIYIDTSISEGFGLMPLEAMACGTPVIASNVTSLPEVCYDSALLIDPYNVDDLSYAIERVLNDSLLMLTMVKKGLMRSLNFSWQDTAQKTVAAYQNMLKCN